MRDFSLDDEKLGDNTITTPVTTPISITDEDKCLVRITSNPSKLNTKEIWNYCVQNIPYFLLVMSTAEAIFFIASDTDLRNLLRFEPMKKHQLWRYCTYMLVHEDFVHLLLNIVLQCIFAFFVERKQGRIRVGVVYLAGGITGVLGASCLNPGLLIGASAGVYAILMSLVADLYLNNENRKYKVYRSLCIIVIVFSDISFNLYHYFSRDEPLISWEAHVFGGITGLILGMAIYDNTSGLQQEKKDVFSTFSLLFYVLLIIILVIITIDTEASVAIAKKKV